MRDQVHDDLAVREAAARFGVRVLFASIGSLFAATLIAVIVTRLQAERWPASLSSGVRSGLFAATAALVFTSFALEQALASIRHNRQHACRRWLWTGALGATAFLTLQAYNWRTTWELPGAFDSLHAFSLSLLTGVHALHVLGGFVPLAIVLHRAEEREYSSSRHLGVRFCVHYWHLIGLIWLVILGTLLVL